MNAEQQWSAIHLILIDGWPGNFTPEQANVYRSTLRRFPVEVVFQAVQELVAAGRQYRPKIAEIAAECHRLAGTQADAAEFDAPPFAEVATVCESAAWEFDAVEGTAEVERQLGRVAAAWFAAAGRDMIRAAQLGDPDFGARERDRVRGSYSEWVGAQRGRARKGLTVTTVEDGVLSRGGLRHLDPARALGGPQGAA